MPRATTGREALKAQSAPADPAILFVIALAIVWIASALLAPLQFTEIDPRNGMPVHVANQLTGTALANFLANMVTEFVTFPRLTWAQSNLKIARLTTKPSRGRSTSLRRSE